MNVRNRSPRARDLRRSIPRGGARRHGSGLNHIERAFAEFRTEVRETLSHINDRCETHGEAIGQHNTRIALVEREIVHFGDRVRILSGEKTAIGS